MTARGGIPEATSAAIIDADLQGPFSGIQLGMMMRTRIARMGVVWLADRIQRYFTNAAIAERLRLQPRAVLAYAGRLASVASEAS